MAAYRHLQGAASVLRLGLFAFGFLALAQCEAAVEDKEAGQTQKPRFRRLEGIYEPSGIAQLADGRLLAIEDEPSRPFSLLSPVDGPRVFQGQVLRPASLLTASIHAIDDLEAVTPGEDGFLFAMTSHSRKSDGKRQVEREQVVRFKVNGTRLAEMEIALGLREALTSAFPQLVEAARERRVKRDGGLNIEGLALGPRGRRLWIGFRGPLIDDRAILVPMLNPHRVFELLEDFHFDQPILLNLDGGGVRDLVYVPRLGGFLILSQRETGKKEKNFKLWLWSGKPQAPARRVRIEGVDDLERAEGLAPIRWAGRDALVLLSDDGNRGERKGARFLLVEYDALRIDQGSPNT